MDKEFPKEVTDLNAMISLLERFGMEFTLRMFAPLPFPSEVIMTQYLEGEKGPKGMWVFVFDEDGKFCHTQIDYEYE